jgi:hypothetical protein
MATFWNGSGSVVRTDGTRTGSGVWAAAKAASVKILSSAHDTHDQGLADSIQACIAKNGENTATNNLPMGTYRHTGVGNATARNHYAAAGQVQDQGLTYCGTSGGSANAQTVTFTPAVTAYTTGMQGSFIAGYTNTSTATLNANGLGVKTIKTLTGKALKGGEITAGLYYEFIYDGTDIILTSYKNSPLLSWTPTLGVSSGTYTSTTITNAKYQIFDGYYDYYVAFSGTTSTTPNNITFTLPIAPSAFTPNGFPCTLGDGGGYANGVVETSGTTATCKRVDGANFSAGTGRGATVNGRIYF